MKKTMQTSRQWLVFAQEDSKSTQKPSYVVARIAFVKKGLGNSNVNLASTMSRAKEIAHKL